MSKVVAIDIGTTGAKVGVFDVQGRVLALAGRSYPMSSPRRGWLEQSPEMWWEAIQEALREVCERTSPDSLEAICTVGQNPTLVCLDSSGEAVRPAITWGDRRAVRQAEALGRRLGRPMDASLNPPKILWLRENRPQEFADTAVFLQSFDYLNFKLTGNLAAVSPLPPWPAWNADDLEAAELSPDLFPEPAGGIGEPLGKVSGRTAQATGLPEGTPVIAGLVDGIAACLGTGAVNRGDLYFGSGTTSGVNLCWPEAVRHPADRFGAIPHPLGDQWLVGGPTSTGSKFLDWFARNICQAEVAEVAEEIAAEAGKESSLIALPYLLGERTPIFDPSARAVFFGLSEGHTRADLGKAVMEAVAFALRDVMELLEESGLEISYLKTGGGGTRSAYWNRIKCDVLGHPLVIPEVKESSLLGAAMVAAWGAGIYSGGREAVQQMFRIGELIEPDAERHAGYSRLFELFRRLYRDLREDFALLAELADTQEVSA